MAKYARPRAACPLGARVAPKSNGGAAGGKSPWIVHVPLRVCESVVSGVIVVPAKTALNPRAALPPPSPTCRIQAVSPSSSSERAVSMPYTRRTFVSTVGAALAATGLSEYLRAEEQRPAKKHVVTLSFDDGFKKSFLRTAEIYEKHKLSACLNVVAAGLPQDAYIKQSPLGDFDLWNELQERGHEIMPHGYRHENLQKVSFDEGKDLIRRCLDVFTEKLKGFDSKHAVFNFPYNASTAELERWLPTQVRAFRTGGAAINPLPVKGQTKLTCTSFGPGNCEAAIDREIERLLAKDSGWLIFNTHGLDEEGWGPMRATYLERLLERLLGIDTVEVLPAGKTLVTYSA
ncbi:MAG: hypothetical protein FJ276_20010 [Planctomycetes bacterium]|nr:hypothetical protein [Planctomycetota bacterium]